MLWHDKVGPVFTASMAEYILAEKNNQQPQPDDEDIPLTPRIECFKGDQYFTNLFDLKATVTAADDQETIDFAVSTQLTDRDREVLSDSEYQLRYAIDKNKTVIKAKSASEKLTRGTALVLPIISPTGEQVTQLAENKFEIQKKEGKITVEANVPLFIMDTKRERVFNMVPGFEAVPIIANFSESNEELVCTIVVHHT